MLLRVFDNRSITIQTKTLQQTNDPSSIAETRLLGDKGLLPCSTDDVHLVMMECRRDRIILLIQEPWVAMQGSTAVIPYEPGHDRTR